MRSQLEEKLFLQIQKVFLNKDLDLHLRSPQEYEKELMLCEDLKSLNDKDLQNFWNTIAIEFERHNCLNHAIYFSNLALSFKLTNYDLLRQLAYLNLQIKDLGKAIHLLTALTQKQANVFDYFLLGNAYEVNKNYSLAMQQYKQVLKLDAEYDLAYFHLARLQYNSGKFLEAEQYYRKALTLSPDNLFYKSNFARMLFSIGKVSESIPLLQEVIHSGNAVAEDYSSLIFMQNHCLEASRKDLLDTAELFKNFIYAKDLPAVDLFKNLVEQRLDSVKTKLRIGFIFPFTENTIGIYFLDLLRYLNQKRFDYYCYHTCDEDYVSLAVKKNVSKWTNITALSDYEAATQVFEDEIDILFDMRTHLSANRTGVLIFRPAPIQIAFYDYIDPVGINQVDYTIMDDSWLEAISDDPRETPSLNMDTFPIYFPLPRDADLSLDASLSGNQSSSILFASLNRFEKITDDVLDLWVQVISSVPGSRILFQASVFADEEMCNYVRDRFEAKGIASQRLIFQSSQSLPEFLKTIRSVDLTLSPFPFPGVTTTFHTLSQGVPVIVLDIPLQKASKAAVAMLRALDLDEFIARNQEEYIEKAIYYANKEILATYKPIIKEKILNARFTNPKLFQAEFEKVLEAVWNKHQLVKSTFQPDSVMNLNQVVIL